MLEWYRSLAQLREDLPVLIEGDYEELLPGDEHIYAFSRTNGSEKAVILANFAERFVPYDTTLAEGLTVALSTHGNHTPGSLQPFEAVIWRN